MRACSRLSGRTLSQSTFKFRGGAGAGLSGPPCVKIMVQDPKNAKQAWCHSRSLASKARAVGAFYSSWGMTGRGIKRTWKPPHHLGLRDESQPLKGPLTKKRFRKRWSLPVPALKTPKRSNFSRAGTSGAALLTKATLPAPVERFLGSSRAPLSRVLVVEPSRTIFLL